MRFLFLCSTISKSAARFERAITHCSREEYLELSTVLTRPLLIHAPFVIAETVSRWQDRDESFKALMSQYDSFSYPAENLPISLLLSHFVAFNADKAKRPEFFCWPGAWMAGDRLSEEIPVIFDRHAALFVDKEDEDGIFPRILPGRDDKAVHQTFEAFYEFNVTYDMTRQWIANLGPFKYDYRWLSGTASEADCKRYADSGFERIYGVRPDDFTIL